MSRRDAGSARQQARHARERLQATLGEAPGLLDGGGASEAFEYSGQGEPEASGTGADDGIGSVPSLRWRVGLRVALLLAGLALAAGSWFWWQAGAATPEVVPLNGASAGKDTATAGSAAVDSTPPGDPGGADSGSRGPGPGQPPDGSLVVVHVAGAVAAPGVIRLQHGSRVDDAISAAGGAVPDADVNRLNLALVVEDGQKIYVPLRGEPASSGSHSAATSGTGTGGTGPGGAGSDDAGQPAGAAGGKINLNTADAAELDSLPKVGPVLAQRIVDWRKDHGPFKSVEELDAVDGVGPKMLETLLPLVTV
ncbi:helix-hairpin-helix domain-containing protein [Pseudarthrobacter sp. C4D7]|uniref:helix-hairpin-helix domain-containing protein n=1 Tax=Pseudarthrobacter sp. C4D7 TaxID=2735268 RepID=UPI001585A06D|nr:helix-hairpin-helix domain-containing protein [Pseudarthrobacter sp. C4D7]NUT72052.1 ComEA family DNA-binding protein [Pseudarthrobacter sp. C4D7]